MDDAPAAPPPADPPPRPTMKEFYAAMAVPPGDHPIYEGKRAPGDPTAAYKAWAKTQPPAPIIKKPVENPLRSFLPPSGSCDHGHTHPAIEPVSKL